MELESSRNVPLVGRAVCDDAPLLLRFRFDEPGSCIEPDIRTLSAPLEKMAHGKHRGGKRRPSLATPRSRRVSFRKDDWRRVGTADVAIKHISRGERSNLVWVFAFGRAG
jgi:hypothetical protein